MCVSVLTAINGRNIFRDVLKTFADTRVALHVKSASSIRYVDYNCRSQRPLACWDSGFDSRRRHRNVSCECRMLSRSGPCVGLITRPEDPSECSVTESDREALIMRRPWSNRGCCVMGGKKCHLHLLQPRSIKTDMPTFWIILLPVPLPTYACW